MILGHFTVVGYVLKDHARASSRVVAGKVSGACTLRESKLLPRFAHVLKLVRYVLTFRW